MQEQLDRIERRLDEMHEMLKSLLDKRKSYGSKRKTRAAVHDESVADYDYGETTCTWLDAWSHWCSRRREAKLYMTSLAIKGALNKLRQFTEAEQIQALKDAAVKPWADVYPKKNGCAEAIGADWFGGDSCVHEWEQNCFPYGDDVCKKCGKVRG